MDHINEKYLSLSSNKRLSFYTIYYYLVILPGIFFLIIAGIIFTGTYIFELISVDKSPSLLKYLNSMGVVFVGGIIMYMIVIIKKNMVDVRIIGIRKILINNREENLSDIKYVREIIILHNSFCWFKVRKNSYFFLPKSPSSIIPLAFNLEYKYVKNSSIRYLIEKINE